MARIRTIRVKRVRWVLGDPEQNTVNGVTTVVRPLYWYPDPSAAQAVRVGGVYPDYAEALMKALKAI